MSPVVAILTANSQSGSGALKFLLDFNASSAAPFSIRGIVRSEELAKKLRESHQNEKNIEFVSGVDANSIDSVAKSLHGVEAALLVTPTTEDRGLLTQNMLKGAKQAGVKFVALASSWTAAYSHPLFKRDFGDSEQLATALFGVSHSSFLRGGYFNSNFLGMGSIKAMGKIFLPASKETRIAVVDPESIGACGAAVILKFLNNQETDHIVDVTGPEALTGDEIAGVFSEILNKKVEFVSVPLGDALKGMRSHGHPEWAVLFVERCYETIHSQGGPVHLLASTDVQRLTGKPYSLKEWLLQHKETFL